MNHRRSLRRFLSRASLTVLVPVLAACSNDSNRPRYSLDDNPKPYPGCEDEFFGECQYWESDCQKQVFATIRCIRGSADAEMPAVVELTSSEMAEELEAELAADDSDPALSAAYERAMVLIGLADEGDLSADETVDAFVDTVPAYYSPDTGAVTIIVGDDGSHSNDDYRNTVTLAHEFVHALQDQEHNLQRMQEELETSYDSYLAVRSAVEGEATLFELFYDVALNGYYTWEIDYRGTFMKWAVRAEAALGGLSPLLAAPRVFPYGYGGRYAYNVYDAGGSEAVRDLPSYIPTTTVEVMQSEYSVADLELPDPFTTAVAPPEGYTYIGEDVLGAWMLSRLIAVRQLHGVDATDVLDWDRDHVAVYSTSEGQVAVVWRLEFASSVAAVAVSAAFSAAALYPEGSGHAVSVTANTVTLLVSDDAASIDAWNAALESGATVTLEEAPAEDGSEASARAPRIVDLVRRRLDPRGH